MGADASGGQYAATIRHHEGTFYVIGTNYGGQGTQGVFYVTATNPAGPWSEPHWLVYWYVDPSLLFADDGVYYLSPNNKDGFLLGILDLETDKMKEPLKKIAPGLGGSSPEGPHLYKINDYYYLMSAEGGTGYEHREVIQRSKSPWGPYEASPHNPVVSHWKDPDNLFHAIGQCRPDRNAGRMVAGLSRHPAQGWTIPAPGTRNLSGTGDLDRRRLAQGGHGRHRATRISTAQSAPTSLGTATGP